VNAKDKTRNSLSNPEMRIRVSENGPYLVSGKIPISNRVIVCDDKGTPLRWSEGENYKAQEKHCLCRCGQSENKPFCDGTHVKVNFDGTETASRKTYMEQAKKISGPSLEMTDAEILCASARFCHRGGEIWELIPRSDDSHARRTAIEDACDCPSGRLVVFNKKTGDPIEPQFKPSITLIEDTSKGVSGPIWVRGGIPVISDEGTSYEVRNRVTLCRCGKSSNKPFCDSSHYPEEYQEY
jgi:CDGSH-type Zn-finger protein